MTMTLEKLCAHEEIRQAIYRHFRAADRLDPELDRTAFWDDGVFEGGPFEGPAMEHMPQLFSETIRNLFSTTMHSMLNMIIDVKNGEAFVEIYATPYHVVPPESLEATFGKAKLAELDPTQSHELIMGTRYIVRMEQRDGLWKIAVMKLIIDWNKVTPYTGFAEGGVMDFLQLRGTRDRSDPSYPWLP